MFEIFEENKVIHPFTIFGDIFWMSEKFKMFIGKYTREMMIIKMPEIIFAVHKKSFHILRINRMRNDRSRGVSTGKGRVRRRFPRIVLREYSDSPTLLLKETGYT